MYLRASSETTSAICFSGTGGMVINEMRLDESGRAEPHSAELVFASWRMSLSASASCAG